MSRVPEGWGVEKLVSLSTTKISNGIFNDPQKVGEGAPLINVVDLYTPRRINVVQLKKLSVSDSEKGRFEVSKGDLLFTRSSLKLEGIAHCNIYESEHRGVVYECHIMRVRPDGSLVDARYLHEFCLSNEARKYFMSHAKTGTMTTMDQKSLGGLNVLLPPLPEQKRIAAILSSVDDAIAATEAVIEQTQRVKEGLLQDLLTRGVGHTRFKQTEIGEIPEGWEVKQLGSYLDYISYGFTNPMPTTDEGPFMVTAKDINHGKIQYDTARHTSGAAYEDLLTDKSRPKVDDVLLTKDGTLGRVCVVDKEGVCINQSVAVLRVNSKILPQFLFYLLSAPQYQMEMLKNAGGSTIKHIYITVVDKMSVAVPPIKEQKQICDLLKNVIEHDDLVKEQLCSLQKTKRGLMQDLLSGDVRVAV